MSSLGMIPHRARISIVAGQSTLVLVPALGGAVVSWMRADEPIFRLPLPDSLQSDTPRDLASYPLFPYSNRIANRRFSFAGETYDLPDLMRGWAIHGAGWQLPWTAHEAGGQVTLSLDYPGGALWPFAFHAEQVFTLEEDRIAIQCVITNRHHAPAPVAFGQHPFFPRSPGATLQFAATGVQLAREDRIPYDHVAVPPEWNHDAARPVGPVVLDHCFTGWAGSARIAYPDRGFALDITADPIFANAVVYIPEGQDFLAFEPVTNITDGINRLDGPVPSGMFVIPPGDQRRGTIRIAIVTL